MAHFKYLGEPARAGVTYGATTKITLKKKDGTKHHIMPPGAQAAFTHGQSMGVNIT